MNATQAGVHNFQGLWEAHIHLTFKIWVDLLKVFQNYGDLK